jgi:hypothetical protein
MWLAGLSVLERKVWRLRKGNAANACDGLGNGMTIMSCSALEQGMTIMGRGGLKIGITTKAVADWGMVSP